MQRLDPAAFAHLIREIGSGKRFGPAVCDPYGQPLAILWEDFRANLRRHPTARLEYE